MTEHNTAHREQDCPAQDIDDLIFESDSWTYVSER